MLLSLLMSAALAGEVLIEGTPSIFAVNDQPITPSDAGVVSPPLPEGTHRLDARSQTGALIAAIDLAVPADVRMVVRFEDGAFTVLRQEPLVAPAAAVGSAPGSVAIVGLDRGAFIVRLSGDTLPYSYPIRSFVALDVPAGDAGFVVWLEGEEVLTGFAAVAAGQHTDCTVLYNDEIFSSDCVAGGRALTVDDVDLVQPISEMKLLSLIERIDAAGRGSRQLEILQEAVDEVHLTCSQLTRLIEPILFGADRLEAVRLALPVLLDPDNAHLLDAAFSFGADRRRLQKLFVQ